MVDQEKITNAITNTEIARMLNTKLKIPPLYHVVAKGSEHILIPKVNQIGMSTEQQALNDSQWFITGLKNAGLLIEPIDNSFSGNVKPYLNGQGNYYEGALLKATSIDVNMLTNTPHFINKVSPNSQENIGIISVLADVEKTIGKKGMDDIISTLRDAYTQVESSQRLKTDFERARRENTSQQRDCV